MTTIPDLMRDAPAVTKTLMEALTANPAPSKMALYFALQAMAAATVLEFQKDPHTAFDSETEMEDWFSNRARQALIECRHAVEISGMRAN